MIINAKWSVYLVMIVIAKAPVYSPSSAQELGWLGRSARAPRLRSMREFAEQEIVLPDGLYEGEQFRGEVQPFAGLYLDAIDSGRWNRSAVTGPTQTGKTLVAFCIPILYHLFELQETVVAAIPHLEMMKDKWREDLLPAIEASRYRDQLPTSGSGSRGGVGQSIEFRNGKTLRWMSGGGDDKTPAGFTSRVLVATEVDGMDTASETSREADRITQLEGRTRAFGIDQRIYLECTVSIEAGRIWQEYLSGTASRIMLPCPHCRQYVCLERKDYHGWQEALSKIAARRVAFFYCSACGERWTEAERAEANRHGVLLHAGQEIDAAGKIHGEPPETDTLGFRWSEVNNLFHTRGETGGDEWKAARARDEENAEKEMRQFVWCMPYEPPEYDAAPLDPLAVEQRKDVWPQGVLPADTVHFVVTLDVHKGHIEFLGMALRQGGQIHIPDYGVLGVRSGEMQEELAILTALRKFRDSVEAGWAVDGSADRRLPDRVWIDLGYQDDPIWQFITESGSGRQNRYIGTRGRGMSQMQRSTYKPPDKLSPKIRMRGSGWHLSRVDVRKGWQVFVDADRWKLLLKDALKIDTGLPGAIAFYATGLDSKKNHRTISRQFASETYIIEEKPSKGPVGRWEKHGQNHYLDCGYNAIACLDFCKAVEEQAKQQQATGKWWGEKKGKRG